MTAGDELFDTVDENDNVIGKATRKEVHTKGHVHRSVLFFLLNKEKKVFVNQRSASKEFYPSYWSIVFGGHVGSGESYEATAVREAKEEAGVEGKPIFLADFKRRFDKEDKENSKVYAFMVSSEPKLDHGEIKRGSFMTMKKLEQKLKEEKFVPETRGLYEILKEFIAKSKVYC